MLWINKSFMSSLIVHFLFRNIPSVHLMSWSEKKRSKFAAFWSCHAFFFGRFITNVNRSRNYQKGDDGFCQLYFISPVAIWFFFHSHTEKNQTKVFFIDEWMFVMRAVSFAVAFHINTLLVQRQWYQENVTKGRYLLQPKS